MVLLDPTSNARNIDDSTKRQQALTLEAYALMDQIGTAPELDLSPPAAYVSVSLPLVL
jgi:hypothetical protein